MTLTFQRGREGKLDVLSRHLSAYLAGSVLDLGCAEKHLRTRVAGQYVGVDLFGAPDVKADLEAGLPFADRSFDLVLAIDVLEHLNRAHAGLDEMCRVSRRYVLIGLPNVYEWHFRLLFALGKPLGGKYGLPPEPQTDRHRWFFGYEDARRFIAQGGQRNGFGVLEEGPAYYAYRRLPARMLAALGKRLGPRCAPLFAWHYWAVLARG